MCRPIWAVRTRDVDQGARVSVGVVEHRAAGRIGRRARQHLLRDLLSERPGLVGLRRVGLAVAPVRELAARLLPALLHDATDTARVLAIAHPVQDDPGDRDHPVPPVVPGFPVQGVREAVQIECPGSRRPRRRPTSRTGARRLGKVRGALLPTVQPRRLSMSMAGAICKRAASASAVAAQPRCRHGAGARRRAMSSSSSAS